MVILGGLEIVAAGMILHKYSKNKDEERAAEEEARERRRERRHNDRKHSHRHDLRPTQQQRPSGSGLHAPGTMMAQQPPPRAQSAPPPRYTPQWHRPPPQGQAVEYYAGHPLQQQQVPQQVPNKAAPNRPQRPPQQQSGYAPQWQAPAPVPQPQPQQQMQQRPRQTDDTFYSNPSHQTHPKAAEAALHSTPSYERLPSQRTGSQSETQLPQHPPPQQQPQPWQTTNPLYAELSGEPSANSQRRTHSHEDDARSDAMSTRYEPTEMGDGDGHHADPPPAYQPYRP